MCVPPEYDIPVRALFDRKPQNLLTKSSILLADMALVGLR